MNIRYYLLAATIATASSVSALTLNQAKQLYLKGEFAKALPTFQENLKKNPKNASLNQWVGSCLYETGKQEEAIPYLEFAHSKSIAESARYLAAIALKNLDYAKAAALIEEYDELSDGDDSKLSEQSKAEKNTVERVATMLNSVEKIQIIDSLNVNKADFFKHFKLAPEAGSLNTADILPYEKPENETSVFMPESKERMLWAMPDSTGRIRLAETYKLNSGKWDKYALLGEELNDNGDVNYPFMMADGTTLYYTCNGDNSIGGYDIFMSRKDLDGGDYLQPQNIGLPYNSPYNDYMLAIDEMTGIGWWATDRNQIPGQVTIYIFIPNSIRKNYDPEIENISALAAVRSIKDSWDEDADYSELIEQIHNMDTPEETKETDFVFYINNDLQYTSYADFHSPEARGMMIKRAEILDFLDGINKQLFSLRDQFHKGNTAQKTQLSSRIVTLERTVVKKTEELQQLENNIRITELQALKK